MPFPTNFNIPSLTPSFGTQLGNALGDLPIETATVQAKKATLDAQTATAQATKQEAVQKQIAQLAQQAMAAPALAQNPQFQKQLQGLHQSIGEQVPMNPDGSFNYAAMQPVKTWSAVSPAERLKYLAAPQGPQRDALMSGVVGIPDEFRHAKQWLPPSSGVETHTQTAVQDAVDKLSKGDMTPAVFKQTILGMADNMRSIGLDPDQYMTPAWTQDYLGQAAHAQIDKLEAMGFDLRTRPQLQEKLLDEKIREFNGTLDLKKLHEHDWEQSILQSHQIALSRLQESWAGLQAKINAIGIQQGNLNLRTQEFGLSKDKFTQSQIQSQYNDTLKQFNAAQSELASTQAKIQNSVDNGGTPSQELTNLRDRLDKEVKDIAPQIQGIGHVLDLQPAQAVEGTSGTKTTPVPSRASSTTPPVKGATLVQSKSDPTKRAWKYPDGSIHPIQ